MIVKLYNFKSFLTKEKAVTIDAYADFIYWMLYCVAWIFLISSVDDLFVDIMYWLRTLFRRNKFKPLPLEALMDGPEQTAAIMVPAWKEQSVIANMLQTNMRFIRYENYMFFVGVYRNDKETEAEVDKVAAQDPRVRKVIVPHDGPTCKADNLNWILQGIFEHEREADVRFSFVVMHDSEDIVHPLELKLFNYLVPRKDLIQIPVRALEGGWHDFVRGTYVDEFAEKHDVKILNLPCGQGMILKP